MLVPTELGRDLQRDNLHLASSFYVLGRGRCHIVYDRAVALEEPGTVCDIESWEPVPTKPLAPS